MEQPTNDRIVTAASPVEHGAWVNSAIPWTKQIVMQSSETGRAYRIYAAIPDVEPPAAGFPVMYVLDANSVIGTVVEAARLQAKRRDGQGNPIVVVGLGFDEELPFPTARFTDYSLPMPVEELPPYSREGEWPPQGGADAFLRFVEEQVKPLIEALAPIDRAHQAIFGHSLGGLFVLHTLYTKPTAFSSYIAGSPSIDWYKRLIFAEEAQFVAQLQPGMLDAGLLIAVGELEQSHPTKINEHARNLVKRLEAYRECGLTVSFHEFAGEHHISVLPPLISRAMQWFMKRL